MKKDDRIDIRINSATKKKLRKKTKGRISRVIQKLIDLYLSNEITV